MTNGLSGKNDGGKKTWNGTHAIQTRKYSPITSQISLSTCANVPASIRKIDRANKTTVSFNEAIGSNTRLIPFQTEPRDTSRLANPLVIITSVAIHHLPIRV